MKVTWLGQAGLLIDGCGLRVLVDPYFSDSVGRLDPAKRRRQIAQDWFFDLQPDVIVFTHDHLDHYDPETAEHFLKQPSAMTILAPGTCWQNARSFGGAHNYVLFDRGTQWTEKALRFTAVTAVHSDPNAIGVLLEAQGVCLYITGDTLYSRKILDELPPEIDAVFLPVNGVGNNMNMTDAARFARECGAKVAVPIHWGMFDSLDPEAFDFAQKCIPQYGKPIYIGGAQ